MTYAAMMLKHAEDKMSVSDVNFWAKETARTSLITIDNEIEVLYPLTDEQLQKWLEESDYMNQFQDT